MNAKSSIGTLQGSRADVVSSPIPPDFQRYLGSPHGVCVAPLWNVEHEAYVGYFLYGFKDAAGIWRRSGEVDDLQIALSRLKTFAEQAPAGSGSTALLLPVNYEVVRRPTRFYALVRAIKELPLAVSKCLVIDLVDIPRGHPNHLLLEKVRSLSNVVKQVMIRVQRSEEVSSRLRAIGVKAITIDFNQVGSMVGREPELARSISIAHDLGITALVLSVGSLHALTTSLGAGADFICGPATSITGLRFGSGPVVTAEALYRAVMQRLGGPALVRPETSNE